MALLFVTTSYTFYIEGDAMLPALRAGDRVPVNRMIYSLQKPQRGDIVVFQAPAPDGGRDFIKRVIAVEGETVEVKPEASVTVSPQEVCQGCCDNCDVYVNNVKLDEPYIKEHPNYKLAPIMVPPGHIFVLGDNRRNSSDSHVWGPLDASHIRGKVIR